MKMKKILAGITAVSLALSSLSIVLLADDETKSEPLVEWQVSPTEEEAAVDSEDKSKVWGCAPENKEYFISVDEDIVKEVNKVVVNVTSDVYANGQLGANVNATEAKPYGSAWGQIEWEVKAAGTQDIIIDNMLEEGGFGQLVAGQDLKFTAGYMNYKDGNDPDSVATLAINSVKFYNSQGTLLGELPSDTTKVVVKYNSWEGGSNYQGTYRIAVPGITDSTTAAEAAKLLTEKVVTVSFSYDSAICNGAAFDTSQFSASGVVQAYGGADGQIWETYQSTEKDGVITIVMDDLAEKLAGTNYTSVNIMVAFATDTVNVPEGADAIRVYLSNLSANVSDKENPAIEIGLDTNEESLEVGDSVTLTATVKPSDTTDKVEWAVTGDEDAVTIEASADGKTCEVTAVSAGTAIITATAGEFSDACTVTVTVPNVPVTGVKITPETLSLKKGETGDITVTVEPDNATDKTVTLESDKEEVATVEKTDDGYKVTAVGKGTAIITATAGEKSAKCTVTVTVPAEKVTLNQETLFLLTGGTETLEATLEPTDSTDTVKWTTGDPAVATVDNGVVTAVGKGTAVITAAAGEQSATCKVTVADPAKKITLSDITVLTGEEKAITYTVDPKDAEISNIKYTSSDETVFTVAGGNVKGVGAGTATLTMTAANQGNEKLEATCKVTVTDEAIAATAIKLSDTAIELEVDGTKTLTAELTPEGSTDKVTWSSSDEEVAVVDKATGKITAKAVGEATITATANENVSATCKVTVTAKTIAVESVTLDKTAATVEEGETVQLTATVKPDEATDKTVTWSTSDETIATVKDGLVTAVKEGKATITAKAGTKTAECTITVTKKVIAIESVTLDKESATLEAGETVQLTATVNPEDTTEDKTVTWSSSNEKIATVDNTGKVTAVKAGEATITAKAGIKSAVCKITVKAKAEETKPDEPKPDDPTPSEDNITISFSDEPYELKVVDATSWSGGEYEHAAQVNIAVNINGVTYGTTTFGEIKNKIITLNNIVYKSCGIEGVDASDIEICIYLIHGALGSETWVGSEAGSMEDSSITWDLSTLAAARAVIPDSSLVQEIGYQINIKGSDVEAIEEMKVGETVEVNSEDKSDDKNKVEKTYEGSIVVNDTAWWTEFEVALDKLIGEFAPEDVKSVEFTCANHGFQVGYNAASGWNQVEIAAGEKKVCTDIVLDKDKYALKVGISAGDGVDYTVSWVTTALVEDDGSGNDKPGEDEKPTTTAVVLSEEETVLDSAWGVYLIIPSEKFANIDKAGKLVVTIKDVAAGAQYGLRYGDSWTNFILPNGFDYSDVMTSSQTSYEVEVDDAFLAILKANQLIITGHDYTIVKVEYVTSGSSTPSEPSTPSVPSTPPGNFIVPVTSGSTSGDTTTEATSAPESAPATAPAESEQAAPSTTEEDTSTNTTSPYATADGGDDAQPTEAVSPAEAIPDDGNNGDVGNAGAGNAEDKNVGTGVTLALIPVIATAAGVIISKKRK